MHSAQSKMQGFHQAPSSPLLEIVAASPIMASASRKICISVDNSQPAKEALTWAGSHFVRPGDEVHLVTVLEPSLKSEIWYGAGQRAPIVEKECEVDAAKLSQAQKLLDSCKQELADMGADPSKITTEPLVACIGSSPDIGRHILDYTVDQGCSTVVMGSRGLGLRKKMMLKLWGLGSVSEYMVAHAPCNVIVHKSRHEQHADSGGSQRAA